MPDSKISADYFANPFAWDGTEVLPGIKGGNNGAGTVSSLQTYFATLKTAQNEAPPVSVASAGTTPIASVAANTVNITGTTTITAFDAAPAGAVRRLIFGGTLILTHNATSLILPGNANITTAAGDAASFVSLGGGNWRCFQYQRASSVGGGGGLVNFAEAVSIASPNTTTAAVQLTVLASTSAADLVLTPKGGGAIVRSMPDGTSTGGNKRGTSAVDLQHLRNNADQVASGQASLVAGEYSKAPGGVAVALGYTVTASGYTSVALGNGCTASGYAAAALGGAFGQASGNHSATLGGRYLATRGISGLVPFGASAPALGQRQGELLSLSITTFGGTATVLSSDTSSPGVGNQLILSNTSVAVVRGLVCARQDTTGDVKGWAITATIKRGGTAGTTALVGTPEVTVTGADAGASAWTVTLSADTANGGLAVAVTGEASKTIHWTAALFVVYTSMASI